MTTNLDEMISGAYQVAQEREQAKRAATEDARRFRDERVQAIFSDWLKRALPSALYEALDVRCEVIAPTQYATSVFPVRALFTDHGEKFSIEASLAGLWSEGTTWQGMPPATSRPEGWHISHRPIGQRPPWGAVDTTTDRLATDLLVFLGQMRAEGAKRRAKQQEQERVHREEQRLREERLQQKKADEARLAAERAAQEAENERRKAQAEREVEQAISKAKETLYTWPQGRTVTLYHWRWCTAPASADAGAEYDEGWSDQPCPDLAGYVMIDSPCFGQRRLRLIPEAHLPVVEERIFESLDELPPELRSDVMITVHLSEPYTEPSHYGYDHSHEVTDYRYVTVGHEPRPWIKELLT